MFFSIIAMAAALAGGQPGQHHPVRVNGTIIDTPVWTRAPSFDDVAAVYPARANGADGAVTLFCRFGSSGALSDCRVTSETPGGLGFGEAAQALAAKFTVGVDPSWAMANERYGVEIPMRFSAPDKPAMRDRLIGRPVWTTKLTASAVAAYFPEDAAAKGLTTGRGVAACRVTASGALTACQPVSAEPEGAGFAEAAAKAAASMRMSAWTRDGGPVAGVMVQVPIRLTVDDTPAAATDHLVWAQTPSGMDVMRAFPRAALLRNVSGQVEMRCRVQQSGSISRCDVLGESPSGWGFASAAQQLAPKYRLSMRGRDHPEAGSWIAIDIPLTTMSH